jgi:hypothetical protein
VQSIAAKDLGPMLTYQDLLKRKAFIFRGQKTMSFHKPVTLESYDLRDGSKVKNEVIIGWEISWQHFEHAFILAPRFDINVDALLRENLPMSTLNKWNSEFTIEWSNLNDLMNDPAHLRARLLRRASIFLLAN